MRIDSITLPNQLQEIDTQLLITNTTDVQTTPDILTVVASVFDSTDNFILQKIFSYDTYDYDFDNDEIKFIEFLKNDILEIDSSIESSLKLGIYRIKFDFINDIFGIIRSEDNKFIITEISSDRTEIRLSPYTNNQQFLSTFNNFRVYAKSIDTVLTADILEFERYVKDYAEVYINNTIADSIFDGNPQDVLTSLGNTFNIKRSKIYDYVLSVYRTQVPRNDTSTIEDINQEAVRLTNIYISQIKRNYLDLLGRVREDLIVHFNTTLKSLIVSQISNLATNEELFPIVSKFTRDVKAQFKTILAAYYNSIFL